MTSTQGSAVKLNDKVVAPPKTAKAKIEKASSAAKPPTPPTPPSPEGTKGALGARYFEKADKKKTIKIVERAPDRDVYRGRKTIRSAVWFVENEATKRRTKISDVVLAEKYTKL